ncbi:NUDIX domain-containing protein [Lactobacillaceae bacterium Melli_B3]
MNADELLRLLAQLKIQNSSINEQFYQRTVTFIQNYPTRLFDRKNMVGHFSASAYAFQGERIWFIKHPYLHTILLPAGHVEPGERPLQTAQREFCEETGFTAQPLAEPLHGLADLNIIEIPANLIKNEGAHLHFDLRYQLKISDQPRLSPELPTFLIGRNDAPGEFHQYFDQKKR